MGQIGKPKRHRETRTPSAPPPPYRQRPAPAQPATPAPKEAPQKEPVPA